MKSYNLGGERIRRAFGERREEVIIFGSRARGDFHEDSDLDVLFIFKGGIKSEDWDRVGELTLELGASVMILPHGPRKDSLCLTAKAEGVRV